MFAGTVEVTNSSKLSNPIVFNISSWSFSDGPMWRRSKVSSLRCGRGYPAAPSTPCSCVFLVPLASTAQRCVLARRWASTAAPTRSLYRKGCDLRVLVSAARESAAFFFASRRVEALQLIMDTASHGSSALTGVSLFG